MGTFVVGAAVLAAVLLAARSVRKARKGGGCAGCPGCGGGEPHRCCGAEKSGK